ncbi:MAG: methionine--tRNA ligase [bacterium]|nr:methionine--tRNA ligase [bacterium]
MINYEDFKKIDLRVAKILSAERIEGSDKLVKLQIDVGDPSTGSGQGLGQRQLVAGIGTVYAPEILVGKQIIIVANLEPKKLMGHESNGMLLAANDEVGPVLLCPESEVAPGTSIK